MANRYVRIYAGPEQSTIVGFSASAIPDNQEGLHGFFTERGYETHAYEWSYRGEDTPDRKVLEKLGGVSFQYLGIKPPISEDHIQEFATWCRRNVDPYHNSGLLIDNRESKMPLEPFDGGRLISEW